MIEEIQSTPPFDVIASLNVNAADGKAGTHPAAVTHTLSAPNTEQDTVELSATAQADQLYLQGDSVTQIAALLGIPTATVESDLNITPPSSTASTAAQGVEPTTAQSAPSLTPADAATHYTAASSPYTTPSTTLDKVA